MGTQRRSDRHFGVREAATACGVSDETIRRRLRAGALPHTVREGSPFGAWRIPLADLLAAGLAPTPLMGGDPAQELEAARDEIASLTVALARAETLAAARLDELRAVQAHLDDLRALLGGIATSGAATDMNAEAVR